ncbi:glycine cleavage system aminomethyltransferase GcvT [Candidatus Mycalebacterium sp.]
MNSTALHTNHTESGATMVEFAGWQMPLFYSSIIDEHRAVRSECGVFDASHMGEIEITGPDAQALCQRLVTNDIARMGEMRAQYNLFCNEDGGILDDLMVYRFSPERFILCVNASNTQSDFEWIAAHARGFSTEVNDISARVALVSVQGPKSVEVVSRVLGSGVEIPARFSFTVYGQTDSFVSRTGYTGEDGFEIFLPPQNAPELWSDIISDAGVTMCGLGCRDTLRLEMGYSLYGNEISQSVTPFEANLGKYVKMDKGDFCGRESLEQALSDGARRALCGLEMVEPGIPRHSYKVFCGNTEVGEVTSGTMSPSLEKPIGLALIDCSVLRTARRSGVEIQIRNARKKAVLTNPPFYRKNTQEEQR